MQTADVSNSIEIQNLCFQYEAATPLLKVAHWQLAAGEQVLLKGPSGIGKSSFLNLIAGLFDPQQGEVQVLGCCLNDMSASQKDRFRAQHVGMVQQTFNLIPYLTVKHNIALAQRFAGLKLDEQELSQYLNSTNLPLTVADKKVSELSVGQQQRIAIIRALINKPQILLVDEPTSALDDNNTHDFMNLLMKLSKQTQASLLMVSHDQRVERYFDNVVQLEEINS